MQSNKSSLICHSVWICWFSLCDITASLLLYIFLIFFFGRWGFLLGHHDGLPGKWCCDLPKPRRKQPCPAHCQVRLQVAARWESFLLTDELNRSNVVFDKLCEAGGTHIRELLSDLLPNEVSQFGSLTSDCDVLFPQTEPHFLHAIEYGNYVYFFFSEIAVEYTTLGKVRVSTWTCGPGNPLSRRPQTNPCVCCCSSSGGLLASRPSLQERQRRLAAGARALLDLVPQGPAQLLRAWRLLLLLWRPAVVNQRAADQPPAGCVGRLHHAGKQVWEHWLNPTAKRLYTQIWYSGIIYIYFF